MLHLCIADLAAEVGTARAAITVTVYAAVAAALAATTFARRDITS